MDIEAEKDHLLRYTPSEDQDLDRMEANKPRPLSVASLADPEKAEVADLKETCPHKTKRICTNVYNIVFSYFGLFILLFAYTFAGAALFRFLEHDHEMEQKREVRMSREDFLNLTWELAQNFTDQDNWTLAMQDTIREYEVIIQNTGGEFLETEADDEWDFFGAMFFCGTLYTTIGYGHISPKTMPGKVATIIYAAIGIPLALFVLADLGRRITRLLKFLCAFVRRYYYTGYCRKVKQKLQDVRDGGANKYDVDAKSREVTPVANGTEIRPGVEMYHGYEIDENFNLPITLAVFIMIVYLFFGVGMYMIWEDWDFLDTLYFVFISISTIGLGDIVPAHPKYFMASSVYLFVGLSLISMVITVAIEFFSETIDKAKETMDKAAELAAEKLEQAKDMVAEAARNIGGDSTDSEGDGDKPSRKKSNGDIKDKEKKVKLRKKRKKVGMSASEDTSDYNDDDMDYEDSRASPN